MNINYIITTWGVDMAPFKNRNNFFLLLYKVILRNASLITSVNSVFCREIFELSHKKAYFIPNGVDNTKFKNTSKKPRANDILFVGSLTEKKGIFYLLKALTKVDKNLYTKLLIAGNGPLRNYLENMTKRFNLQNNVVFLGNVPNVKLVELYGASKLAVFPSITTREGDREGLPTVLLEAMACECPVITTRIEGIESIFKNEFHVLIVRQKDSKDLANAIVKLLNNETLRKRIAKNGFKEVVKNYSWNVIAEKYSNLISKL